MNRSEISPWAIMGLYLFALVLILSPLVDLVSTVWPPRPADLSWRYGFLGLSAGYLNTPMLGLAIAAGVAHWRESRAVMKGLGVAMMIVASVLLLVMAMFMLDVLQVRELRPEEARSALLVGGLLQELKYGAAFLILSVSGLGALKTASGYRSSKRPAPGIVASAN